MFLGIPYAKVNESNPFGESLPQPPFATLFEANNDEIMCPQSEEFNQTIQGTINCLTLNIYVPKTANSTNKLPVLIYFYGGNYILGFNRKFLYGPKYLVRHDIIIVVFNYRVGPYGFLCLDIPEVPGNQGFKDQKNALRWVYKYIEEFGGDRNKITLDGHSFGAISVDLLLHSLDENERLFDKVILQSGPIFTPHPVNHMPHDKGVLKLAKYLGANTSDVKEAITFLSSVNPSLVIEASKKVVIPYRYCVEKPFENVNKLISDYPWNMKVPAAKNISFMVGNIQNETLFIYGLKIPEIIKRFDPILVSFKHFNMTREERYEMAKIIRDFYEVDRTFSMETVKEKFVEYGNDFDFLVSSRLNMFKYMENGAKDVYYYMFSYEGQRNFMTRKLGLTTEDGAMHGDEISFIFDVSFMEEPSPEDQLIIDRMTTLWANFVKYG
nr:esterase [Manduca sexta]